MTLKYENKYGYVEIEVVGEYRNVSGISSRDMPNELFFSIDIAEKIALITGNDGIQISFCYPDYKRGAFVIHHQSSAIAAECRILKIEFDKKVDAREELSRPNPYRGLF